MSLVNMMKKLVRVYLMKEIMEEYSIKDGNENQRFSRTLDAYPVRIRLSKADTSPYSISIKVEIETLPQALPQR